MANRKIEALQEAAAEKARESAERVEKALEKMIKQGQVITFKSVAHVANVSTAYLYKQAELRSRIETIRDQQKNRSKPKQPPPASENSKAAIIYNLREDNKRLRAEIEEIRKINESLTGRLYQLQGASNLAERLRAENESLKQQLDSCRHRHPAPLPANDPKVSSLEKKRKQKTDISEHIKIELDVLGIQLNSTLSKTIRIASEDAVLAAIEALKQAMEKGEVKSPGGWLKSAIEDGWTKNSPQPQQISTYNPLLYTAPEESEEELVSPEQIKELWKGINNDRNT